MKTFTIEEGQFTTEGRIEDDGTVIGELTNYRGTRRWAVQASDIGLTPAVAVVEPVTANPDVVSEVIAVVGASDDVTVVTGKRSGKR